MHDPYFYSHADQLKANIIAATLLDLGADLWTGLTPLANGRVQADHKSGIGFTFDFDRTCQCLITIERHDLVTAEVIQ